MAQVDCAGTLQLLCGTGEHRQSQRIPGSANRAVVANSSPPQPNTPDLLDTYSRSGCPMAPSSANTPSLSRGSLCRQSSAIRTGCANQRPSGSARGVPREWYPYRDLKTRQRVTWRCYNNVVDMAAHSACNSQREQATCDSGWLDSRPANAAGAEQIA
jgi:hypothetical protein